MNEARGFSTNWEIMVEASAATLLLAVPTDPACSMATRGSLDINPEQHWVTILHTVSKVVCQLTRDQHND